MNSLKRIEEPKMKVLVLLLIFLVFTPAWPYVLGCAAMWVLAYAVPALFRFIVKIPRGVVNLIVSYFSEFKGVPK